MQKRQAERLCDITYRFFLAAGILVPLLRAGKRGKVGMLRSLESLGLSFLASETLKHTISERRPDSLDQSSFPSGHAMNSMTVATVAAKVERKQALFWYLGSALIGLWRIGLGRHRTRDVFLGGLMGFCVARFELSRRRGVLYGLRKRRVEQKGGKSAASGEGNA